MGVHNRTLLTSNKTRNTVLFVSCAILIFSAAIGFIYFMMR